MEILAVILMLAGGTVIAVFVLSAMAIAKREGGDQPQARSALRDGDTVAASLLFQTLILGGVSPDDAMRDVRRHTGLIAPVTSGIDILNWGAAFAERATAARREWLLDCAVQLIVQREKVVPLRQYVALLDLSFALGFHTDALAKLRERYGFDYIDHAKDARPRSADRAGATTFFARDPRKTDELLRLLRVEGQPTRQSISAAYRRLVTQHHPDRFHAGTPDEQSSAAAQFIELTRAYETLLTIYRD